MSDLLLMAGASGLPKQGLCALYDPYRDVYGRNVLPVGAEALVNGATGWNISRAVLNNGVLLETADSGAHSLIPPFNAVAGTKYVLAIEAKANGRNRAILMPRPNSSGTYGVVAFDLITGAATQINGGSGRITAYGSEVKADGYVLCWIAFTAATGDDSQQTGAIGTAKDDNTFSYAGEVDKGLLLRNPQLNLGPVLHPYSAPAGAPGTLQTSLDYSGNGNNLTLGADTNASTDDPAFTGTAWSFDGGDYLLTPITTAKLNPNLPMTMLAVFKVPAYIASTQRVVNFSNGGTAPAFHGRNLLFRAYENLKLSAHSFDGGDIFSSASVTAGQIIVGALRYDGSKQSVFVNGVKYDEKSAGTVSVNASIPARIGSGIGDGYFTNSDIHLVGFWQQSISDSTMMRTYRYLKSLMAERGVAVA